MKKSIILFGDRETGKTAYCEKMASKYPANAVLRWTDSDTALKAFLTIKTVMPETIKLIILDGVRNIKYINRIDSFFHHGDSPRFQHIKLIITSNNVSAHQMERSFCALRLNFKIVDTNAKEEWKSVGIFGRIHKMPFKLKSKLSNKKENIKYDRFMIALQKASDLYNKALIDIPLSKDLFSVFESGEVDLIKAHEFQEKYPQLFKLN